MTTLKCENYMNVCLYTEARAPATHWAWLDKFLEWQDRYRSRRQLAALDDRMLKDIGVGRDTIGEETRKPFWTA